MKSIDLEELNRNNYKAMINTLSMPGKVEKITPLYNSALLAMADVVLYSEVSFFYDGHEDMNLIEAVTNPIKETKSMADYIFCDFIDSNLVKYSKNGNYVDPDFSAILFFTCKDFHKTKVMLKGPGINIEKEAYLPCNKAFISEFMAKNSEFPLGVEVYFINNKNEILALSRTTKIEVL